MFKVRYTLIDMNNLLIEKEDNFILEDKIKDELELFLENHKKGEHFLNVRGLGIERLQLKVNEEKKFIIFILNLIFPDYQIKDTNNIGRGHPDYILSNDQEKIYLELKKEEDGLRREQIKWFIYNKNKDYKNKIIWLSIENQNKQTFKSNNKIL